MKRVGIAASKMAKGSLLLYNLYVILISLLFSSFLFIIAGSAVLLALVVIAYISETLLKAEIGKSWASIFSICMVTLTIIIAFFNLLAISMNMKLFKK